MQTAAWGTARKYVADVSAPARKRTQAEPPFRRRAAPAGAREQATVLHLLDWAFRRQRAHCEPETEYGGAGYPPDSCARLQKIGGALGTHIDGGQWIALGYSVDPDAAAIVSAVRYLDHAGAHLVWMHASAGTQPDWGEDPRYYPKINAQTGKPAIETDTVMVPDKLRRPTTVVVRYCPVTLLPDVGECRREWGLWWRALSVLQASLPPLSAWSCVGVGAAERPWG